MLKEEIKELLTRLNDEFDRIREKRRDNSKVLETITDKWIDLRTQLFGFESVHLKRGTPEYSIREIDELLKTLSDQF